MERLLSLEIRLTIRRETNKYTEHKEFENPLEAARALLELLSDEDRAELLSEYTSQSA